MPKTLNYKRHPDLHEVTAYLTGVEPYNPDELNKLIPALPAPDRKDTYSGPEGVGFTLEEWFTAFPEAEKAVLGEFLDAKARVKHASICPWVSEHTGGDASGTYVGQYEDGGLFFQCWHGHCAERRWEDYRAFYDPEHKATSIITKQKADALVAWVRGADREEAIRLVWDSVKILAALSPADYGRIKGELKDALPRGAVNLPDLKEAVTAERKRARQEHRDQSGLPEVECADRPLRDRREDTVRTLHEANDPPRLFVRGGVLARVYLDERGQTRIGAMDEAALRNRMTDTAEYVQTTDKGTRHVTPPKDVVQSVLSPPDGEGWPYPVLENVVQTPVLRQDGTILSDPGYDPATGLIYAPSSDLHLPEIPLEPTAEQVQAALKLLDEAIGQFSYLEDADKANTLALFLTLIMRPVIDGLVPMAVLDAPSPGTGKGLLVETACLIATGQAAAPMSEIHGEDEWRKQITAALYEGEMTIFIDNIEGDLKSAALAAALTAPWWRDRKLGHTERLLLPQRATWMVSGNNVRLRGDLPRRCYQIRLDAKTARPWARTGFKHHLPTWVPENRGELLGALLTLARSWFAAGCPEAKSSQTLGRFEEWVRTIGGVLEHAGVEGFLNNLDRMYEEAEDEVRQWTAFLAVWHHTFGDKPMHARKVIKDMQDHTTVTWGGLTTHQLLQVLPDELDGLEMDRRASRKLGDALDKIKDRRFGEYRIEQRSRTEGAARWLVLREDGSGTTAEEIQEYIEDDEKASR